MNLLTLIQTFAKRSGLPVPTGVAASTEAQILQIAEKLNEVLEDLTRRWNWETLTYEATFTTIAGEAQGKVKTLAPNGYLRILNETFMSRGSAQWVHGPLTSSKWQEYKSRTGSGTFPYYRFRGGELLMLNVAAGQVFAFEYASSLAVAAENGTRKSAFTADTDASTFDDALLLAGLRWKWLATKGLEYAEDFRRYEDLANTAAATETPKPSLSMNSDSRIESGQPGILIPSGSWAIS